MSTEDFKHRYHEIADRLTALGHETGYWVLDGYADGAEYVDLDVYPHEDNQLPPVLTGVRTIQMADFLAHAQEDFIWLLSQLAQHKNAIEGIKDVVSDAGEMGEDIDPGNIIYQLQAHLGETE